MQWQGAVAQKLIASKVWFSIQRRWQNVLFVETQRMHLSWRGAVGGSAACSMCGVIPIQRRWQNMLFMETQRVH